MLQHAYRGVWVERHTCLTAGLFDLLNYPVKVVGGFGVNGDVIGTSPGKTFDVALRLIDHQMDVQVLCRILCNLFNDELAEGDVRHEATIHHIEVKPVGFGGIYEFDGLIEAAEIGG